MKENCKIEISSHSKEEDRYRGIVILLEGEYMAVPSGDYIDLANKKIWIVTGLLISMSHTNNRRMIRLTCKDDIHEEPYKGMILEKID